MYQSFRDHLTMRNIAAKVSKVGIRLQLRRLDPRLMGLVY